MRNFSLLLLLITAISFSSCKKDPSTEEKNAKNLIGKWFLKSVTEKNLKNGTSTNQQTTPINDDKKFVEFRSNGTAVDLWGDEFNYKISNSKITMRYNEDDEDYIQDIIKITSNELVLSEEDVYTEGNDTFKYITEYTFTKK
ncbi:MAG: lipocalin family protein [Pedobacter sp.]|uniref:lipocalin family protein n=1 Tax=Pedobacter sp. TaxID=1411316 RepID=UPI0035628A10